MFNGVYTQTINRRHRRAGHVFQGRYKGILVERDSYLLELSRYVVLNPVRAKMVKHVRQWKWSSYHAMTGTEPAPPWLQTDWVLGQFGHLRAQQVARYIEFVQEGVRGSEVWQQLKGQIYLGTDAFVGVMSKQVESDTKLGSREIPRSQRRALAKSLTYYRDEFEDHYSTVSRAIGGK